MNKTVLVISIMALMVIGSFSYAQDCGDILKHGIFDEQYHILNVYQKKFVLSHISKLTYQQAKGDTKVNTMLIDIFGGSYSKEKYDKYKKSITRDTEIENILLYSESYLTKTINQDIVEAWLRCMNCGIFLSITDMGSNLLLCNVKLLFCNAGYTTLSIRDIIIENAEITPESREHFDSIGEITQNEESFHIIRLDVERPVLVTVVTEQGGSVSSYLPSLKPIPPPPPRVKIDSFKITTSTSNVDNADTDAGVFISIAGREFKLDTPGRNDFERNNSDIFIIPVNFYNLAMDDLESNIIKIRHDNEGPGPGWNLSKLKIEYKLETENSFITLIDESVGWLRDNKLSHRFR